MADENLKNNPQQSDLEKIAAILLRHQVEFLVIGGQAEVLMGSPRVTDDTDLCYRRTPQNLERLAAALREIKPSLRDTPAGVTLILDSRALALGNNFTLNSQFGALDLIGWVEPLGEFDALIPGSESFVIGKMTIRTIGLNDLIRVKERVGRSKDRESLMQLRAIHRLRHENQG